MLTLWRVWASLLTVASQINRLTSQLSHVEGDLQANIDLVNTLESALNDSERNLRKARLQMADLARERDSYMGQNDMLRLQIQEAHTEVEAVRRSVLQVESRLQEERQGRDSVKAELQARLDDAARRKSKCECRREGGSSWMLRADTLSSQSHASEHHSAKDTF